MSEASSLDIGFVATSTASSAFPGEPACGCVIGELGAFPGEPACGCVIGELKFSRELADTGRKG